MNNQQKFNELSADLFLKLYESFPVGIDINIEDYPDFNTVDNSYIFFATIKFYIDESFLRCSTQYYGGFSELVLTSKGFSVLNAQPPEKISTQSNFASALKDAAGTEKTELIKGLVSETIKFAFKLALS